MDTQQIEVKPLQWAEDDKGHISSLGFLGNQYELIPSDDPRYYYVIINGNMLQSRMRVAFAKSRCNEKNAAQVIGYFDKQEEAAGWVENPEAIQQPDLGLMKVLGQVDKVCDELDFVPKARLVVETLAKAIYESGQDIACYANIDGEACFCKDVVRINIDKNGNAYKCVYVVDESGTLVHDSENPDHVKTLPLLARAFL